MLCIFCAKECPPAFVIERGKLMRVKEEVELNSFGCENVILARQLRAINIMRNILDIPKETCYEFLAQYDGQFNPEYWVKVCASCKVFVEEYNTTRREIARLEKKANNVKEKLKGFISTSNQNEELDGDSLVWREIREEVLAGFQPAPPEPLITEDEQQQEESQVNVQMDVEVEPEFCIKTELLEEPGSWARKKWQRTVKAKQAATVGKRQRVRVSKTGKPAQKPMETEGNGESEGNSVELNSELEVEHNNDTNTEQTSLLNKPETIVVENVTTHAAASGNVNVKTISSLPDTSRLVHCQGKAAINGEMEQKLLSFFTKWHTQNHYSDLGLDALIPALWIQINPRNLKAETFEEQHALFIPPMNSPVSPANGVPIPTENYYKLFSPPGMFGNEDENPFPSSSLRLGMRRRKVPTGLIPDGNVEREIYPIFRTYGKFLAILVLDGYRVHAREFAELLSHLPKLKSLTLEAVQFHGGESFNWNVSTLPSLNHLTHLRCVSFGQNNFICEALKPEPFLWILEKYGNKLIGLTVSGLPYLSSEHIEKLEKTIQFGNLKQLKVDSNNTSILKLTREAKLSHIMVQSYSKDKNTLRIMLPLIESFSESLECLWMPSKIIGFVQNRDAVDFPKVKELAIRASSELFGLKNLIQSRFHEIEKLQFICYVEFCPGIEVEQYWSVLPKLKTITYFDDRRNVEVEKSRRNNYARTHVVWSGDRLEELLPPNNIHANAPNRNRVTNND